jgi:hypothetical protein
MPTPNVSLLAHVHKNLRSERIRKGTRHQQFGYLFYFLVNNAELQPIKKIDTFGFCFDIQKTGWLATG